MSLTDRHITTMDNAPLAQTADVYPHSAPPVEQIELSRVLDVIRRRFWLMLATLVVVLAAGAVFTLHQKPVYESTALMIVATNGPVTVNSNDATVVSDVVALTKSRSIQSQIELISSPEVIRDASMKLGEGSLTKGFGAINIPQWALSVDSKKDSDVISITAKAYDPEVAANLANSLVSAYIERDQMSASQASRQGREYVSSELKSVSDQLSDARKKLSDYKKETKMLAADDQLRAIAGNLVSLQMDQDKADIELAAAQKEAETFKNQLAKDGHEVEGSSTIQLSPQYQQALTTLAKLYTDRASLIQEYAPESKQIKKIDGAIASTIQVMNQAAQTITATKVKTRNPDIQNYTGALVNRAASSARIKALKRVLAARDAQVQALPEQERALTKLIEKVTVLERTYQMLSDKYYTLLVNEKSTVPSAKFASTAYPAPSPSAPDKKKNAALFFLLGCMLSVGVATVAERLDKKVRYDDIIVKLTGEAPLAVIPNLKGADKANLQLESVDQSSGFIEAFRVLRNIIDFGTKENPVQIVAVTSPGRAEGKSITSVNLAVAAALSGKKVLVVDCDLRRPSLHKKASIKKNIGFTNLVRGLISIEEAAMPTHIPNLYCLPAGPIPPNPADFLNLPECRATFEKLREKYDWVIIDGPPCAGLSDMQVVSTISDGVLLVVSVNQTEKSTLQNSVRVLSLIGAPYIGSIVNKCNDNYGGYDAYRPIANINESDIPAIDDGNDQD
ncbi:MAG: polysaccharide biosynthesis tyrosine autokinase [Armatimonadota bacterium]